MNTREKVLTTIDANRNKTMELAHWIYENPEIALEEVKSCKYTAEFMREAGFDVTLDVVGMPNSFKAVKKNGDGPRIAFLAEYDALPEVGHACGHHLIDAMSCAAGVGLAEALKEYEGEVAVFGTPAEETGDGKAFMTEHGAFDGYDAALEVHPGNTTIIFPNEIAITGYDYTFTGVPAHAGACPSEGVNACDAVVLFFQAIGLLRQQLKDGTRVHGIIQEAGTAANVIPGIGRARVEFRSDDMKYFNNLIERVHNCARGAGLATGCEVEFHRFEPVCYNLKHNRTIGDVMTINLKELGIEKITIEGVDGGSTDVGNVSQVIPCIQPYIETCPGEADIHTVEFRDKTLEPFACDRAITAAKALALTGLELLTNAELLQQVKEEFEKE